MDIKTLRTDRKLSQQALASMLGVGKSYVCMIEKRQEAGETVRVSARLALEIERLSEGEINAASMSSDVALVEAAKRDQAA